MHNWGELKVGLGRGQDRIGTLVPMAMDSSHRVVIGKIKSLHFLRIFILAGKEDNHKISVELNFRAERNAPYF